jgi:tRNA (guanine-N7-)-methyltransferase
LLDELLPKLSLNLPAADEEIDLAEIFPFPLEELWLEIGFGAGEHLAWQMSRQMEMGRRTAFIGIDYFVNGIAKLLARIEGTAAPDRLRIYQGDARDVLTALPKNSLTRVFVLFPDPWPKGRHHRRRLIRKPVLDRIAALLRLGGEMRLATDDPGYLEWIMERVERHEAFSWTARRADDWRRRPDDWPATRYEEKAVRQGRSPYFLCYRRVSPDVARPSADDEKTLAGRALDA